MEEYPTMSGMFDRIMASTPDPIHAMMVRRKKQQDIQELPREMKYHDDDIKQLEEFCRQHGILGFNCGTMNPKLAMRMLKAKLGVIDDNYNKTNSNKNLLLG